MAKYFRFLTSVLFTTWVAAGGTIYKRYQPYASITSPPFPNSTSGCPSNWADEMEPEIAKNEASQPLPGHLDLYDISYVWYSCIGSSLVVIVALLSSCIISSQDLSRLDGGLLAPFVPKMLSRLPQKLRQGWISGDSVKDGDEDTKVTRL